MAELSPVETLRAAAASARRDESLEFAYVLGPLAEPLAFWLEYVATKHQFAIDAGLMPTGDVSRALPVARVLLGVPDA